MEYSIFKSSILSAKFQEVVSSIHTGTDFADFEKELAKKLINKGVKKTEIAYQLAQIIDADAWKETCYRNAQESGDSNIDNLPVPEIEFDEGDTAISYLFESIKYACRD